MTRRCCSRGHHDTPISGVCPACLLIAEGNADRLEHLVAEVRRYLDAYTSRGIHAEGVALARLRKAIEPQENTALQIPGLQTLGLQVPPPQVPAPNQNEREEQT